MEFLIDANIPRSTKSVLESLGHNVIDGRDVLPPAAPDADVASLALAEKRVILTRDQDFANILLYPPQQFPGIIVLKVHALPPSGINRLIALFLTATPAEAIHHSLIILEHDRFRVKR